MNLFCFLGITFVFNLKETLTLGLSTEDADICTDSHNKVRRLHTDTPHLEWDSTLAAIAQLYAEKLVRINRKSRRNILLSQSPSMGLGENIYWQDNRGRGRCSDAVQDWYKELKNYSYRTTYSKKGGAINHFTQLIWRRTNKVGVGIATMPSRKFRKYGNVETFIVAKYSPRGNDYDFGERRLEYADNVQPRK